MELPIELVEQTKPQPLTQRQKELLMLFYALREEPRTPLDVYLKRVEQECKFQTKRLGVAITPFHPAQIHINGEIASDFANNLAEAVYLQTENKQAAKQKPEEFDLLDIKMYF